MPKTPVQAPIKIKKQGDGMFASVSDALVPQPPEGCESQQMMDWGATVAVMKHEHINLPLKLRMVEAYAQRWGIATEEGEFSSDPNLGIP